MFGGRLAVARSPPEAERKNVLFIVVDNLRPALGAYGVAEVLTPEIDRLAAESVLFDRAYCQEAWCSPSRNSFLTGRRPDTTRAWGFISSFRDAPGGADWVALPQYFVDHGYFAASSGKVYHPSLPAREDYPRSWSIPAVVQMKSECVDPATRRATMICEYSVGSPADADQATANLTLATLAEWSGDRSRPFFLASGFQGPRLAWSYPTDVAARYPPAEELAVTALSQSPADGATGGTALEWFRPTEIDWYADVEARGGVMHDGPMPRHFQQLVRRAYYATISHVDDQVGRLLRGLAAHAVDQNTVVVFTADHGQNLGEFNMWSMMNLLETSLRVPLLIRPAGGRRADSPPRYRHPVELVDLYPTLAALTGLPAPPSEWGLEGTDLSAGIATGAVVKPVDAAFGQITRCHNCNRSYSGDPRTYQRGCAGDAIDARLWTVPCAQTPSSLFDFMGMTIRTSEWRYTAWCGWDGEQLTANWSQCVKFELYNHTADLALYDVETNGEANNLAGYPGVMALQARLHALLRAAFQRSHGVAQIL